MATTEQTATAKLDNYRTEQGYVFDTHKLIYHLDRVNDLIQKGFCMPLHIDISPSGACDVKCVFCLFRYLKEQGKQIDVMPREILINLVKDSAEVGIRSILFAGDGEPFTNPALPEAITTAGEVGIDCAVATHGGLIKEHQIKQILEGLTWIRFSVAAATAETYSKLYIISPKRYDKVLRNMAIAVETKEKYNLPVTVGTVYLLLPENRHELVAAAERAVELGLDYLYVKKYQNIPENPYQFDFDMYDDMEDIYQEAEALSTPKTAIVVRRNMICVHEKPYDHCLAIPFITHVGSDSRCYTCAPKIGLPEGCYGDLRKNRLPEILNSDQYRKLVKHFAEQLDVHDKCPETCKQDYMNRWLWQIKNPPQHVNFI